MKTYKKVEVEAVNSPSGSYAAGCPAESHQSGVRAYEWICRKCEVRN